MWRPKFSSSRIRRLRDLQQDHCRRIAQGSSLLTRCGLVRSEVSHIPFESGAQAGSDSIGGLVSEEACGFADIGLRIADISWPKTAIGRYKALQMRIKWLKRFAEQAKQLIQTGSGVYADVVDLVHCFASQGGRRQKIRLHDVFDIAVVAPGFPVAINKNGFVSDQGRDPLRDHRSIRAFRILPGPKDVKVTESHGFQSITAAENLGVQLIDVFG